MKRPGRASGVLPPHRHREPAPLLLAGVARPARVRRTVLSLGAEIAAEACVRMGLDPADSTARCRAAAARARVDPALGGAL